MLISLNVNFVVQVYNQFFRMFLLQDVLNVSLEIPKTGKYRVLVKYTNEGVKAQLNVALQFQNTSGASDPMIFSASLAEGCDNCLETINPNLDYLSLTNGTWMISITTMQRYDQLKLVKSQFALTPLLFYLNYIAISWYSTILLHRNVKCEKHKSSHNSERIKTTRSVIYICLWVLEEAYNLELGYIPLVWRKNKGPVLDGEEWMILTKPDMPRYFTRIYFSFLVGRCCSHS